MVDERLIEYIKLQRETGYPDQMIRDLLTKKGLSEKVIEEAMGVQTQAEEKTLTEDDKQDLAKAVVATQPDVPPPPLRASEAQEQPDKPVEQEESKGLKARKNGITAVFLFMSSIYSGTAIKILFVVVVLQQAFSQAGDTISVLESFPSLLVGSYLLMALSIYCWYLVFKSRVLSRDSWKIMLVSVIALPLLASFLGYVSVSGITAQLKRMGEEANLTPLVGWDYLWGVVGAVLLYLSRGDYQAEENGLSKKQKIWFGILTGISIMTMVIATIVMVSVSRLGASDNYQEVTQQVSYPVKKIGTLPEGIVRSNNYQLVSETGDPAEGVRVAVGTKLTEVSEVNQAVITINQMPVGEDYDLQQDTNEFDYQQIQLATGQLAQLGSKPLGSELLWSVRWVENGVLIQVTGLRTDAQTVQAVAQGLE